jgi:hypothetical protein
VRRIYFAICVFYKIENAGILRLAGRLWERKKSFQFLFRENILSSDNIREQHKIWRISQQQVDPCAGRWPIFNTHLQHISFLKDILFRAFKGVVAPV